jgi:glutaredoxin
MHFTLYSRSYCHLCQDMLDALMRLQPPGQTFTVDVIDIDQSDDPVLLAKYDELVPVLFADLAQPALCHYFLDEGQVHKVLKT